MRTFWDNHIPDRFYFNVYKWVLFAEINEPYTLGYINFLGFMIFIPVTLPMARVGARFINNKKRKIK